MGWITLPIIQTQGMDDFSPVVLPWVLPEYFLSKSLDCISKSLCWPLEISSEEQCKKAFHDRNDIDTNRSVNAVLHSTPFHPENYNICKQKMRYACIHATLCSYALIHLSSGVYSLSSESICVIAGSLGMSEGNNHRRPVQQEQQRRDTPSTTPLEQT